MEHQQQAVTVAPEHLIALLVQRLHTLVVAAEVYLLLEPLEQVALAAVETAAQTPKEVTELQTPEAVVVGQHQPILEVTTLVLQAVQA